MNQMSVRAEDAEKRAEEAEETIKTVRSGCYCLIVALLKSELW
jgi:hypothetical protein